MGAADVCLQSISLSCYPFHILLVPSIVANQEWTLHQGIQIWKEKVSFARAALAGFNLRWVFQLPKEEVSSKLAVILAIQLLGLKWEFKVNFMQI